MADSFHTFPATSANVHGLPIAADQVTPLYRVVCPDGRVHEDVDTPDAALEAAKWADAMHDNAICDGRHRILLARTYTEIER